ncbi:hypothetical protein ELQ90_12490 [Labedella phragmitis]|uniref:Uncharacterized protein n=1 Tax=Labedella phragmitis TaxID=2498849 RepID=A0A444PQN1_9MICO|nr:hypothetical protein [Labedella phragmitis]RWZ49577.1 hypothetical protein ELQ90_12490 [Labedella phragmitis]
MSLHSCRARSRLVDCHRDGVQVVVEELAFTDFALRSFGDNPWTGVGIGSQSVVGTTAVQITDGAHLAVAVEGGLALFIPWMMLILTAAVTALYVRPRMAPVHRFLALALIVFIVYQFGVASFVNSSIIGKTPFLLFWASFGIMMALARVARADAQSAELQKEPIPAAVITK